VGLLYRPSAGTDEEGAGPGHEGDALPISLLIAKQRNGPTGEVPLTFLRSITRFESASKVSADDLPADS
jgi:replicative DNA helicase